MDPDDIKKGRILTWGVILLQGCIAMFIMIWLASIKQTSLDLNEISVLPVAEQDIMKAVHKENFQAIGNANIAGPVSFVLILGMCIALLGGNWWVRIGVGIALILFGAATVAAPWIAHSSVLKPDGVPIFVSIMLALLHICCGAVLLLAKPVRMFLHPHRMMYAMAPQKP